MDRSPVANAELGTIGWFALQPGPSALGVFDTFAERSIC